MNKYLSEKWLQLKKEPKSELTFSEKLEFGLEVLIYAGTISFIFLIIYFLYQLFLVFWIDTMNISIKSVLYDYPVLYTIYNHSNQILILIYLFVLIIVIFWIVRKNRTTRRLASIRKYISRMAQGDYQLRIPDQEMGDYQNLSQDVNTLMDSINQAFLQRNESEKSKDELINNISHDIRTPLTSIMGYLNLIQDKKDLTDEQLKEYIDLVYAKCQNLKGLLDDLFVYTSSQDSTARMDFQFIPLNFFLEQIQADFDYQAQKLGIDLQIDVNPSDLEVLIDPEKIVRVLNNLITNAFKYGKGARYIRIQAKKISNQEYESLVKRESLHALDKGQPSFWLEMEVANDGQLLDEKELEKIFERSYRSDKSRNSKEPGSGLGLAIVRNIIRLHKGDVHALVHDKELVFRILIPQYRSRSSIENKLTE